MGRTGAVVALAFQRVKQDQTPNDHMGWKAHATTSAPCSSLAATSEGKSPDPLLWSVREEARNAFAQLAAAFIEHEHALDKFRLFRGQRRAL